METGLDVAYRPIAYVCECDMQRMYAALSYVCSQLTCLAIDVLLVFIVDGISKNILSEIRSMLLLCISQLDLARTIL